MPFYLSHSLKKATGVFIAGIFSSLAFADFSGPSPWPEIRKERIQTLLPTALKNAGVDAWLVICRENNNDPLADHIGCENAGKTAAFLFFDEADSFTSLAFSPVGEATALADSKLLNKVIPVARNESAIKQVAAFIKQKDFKKVAINTSTKNAQADGLSHAQYEYLTKALGEKFTRRLVSADEVVYQWLSIKLPEEVEIMRKAAELTAKWQLEAYASVIPGKTKDSDVAQFLKQKMQAAGVGDAWAPDQNPNVVSGTDRGHSHATDKIINYGDVIQTDFGIRVYDRWVTDIQRFAYVLKPDESQPPKDIAHYWRSAKAGRDAAFAAMKPGVRGIDVDAAQRKVMEATGSRSVMWSTGHPVGYVAHDTGPNLGGSKAVSVRPASQRELQAGMTFAFDGFHSWQLDSGKPKTISVEEMVYITEKGAVYLVPPQLDLFLISSAN